MSREASPIWAGNGMGGKRVVVAGGGLAGSLVAKLLELDAEVTLIDRCVGAHGEG